MGTENTLNAAIANNVKRAIVLSTDKAVYPINAMGMSKALMEKVTVATSRNVSGGGPVMCNTRYGNVMASRGSVIPLFVEQLKAGKPLTITDPDMTRFMMSLPDAVELVLFAFDNGAQGDTFVQKAPAATIITLVEALKKMFDSTSDVKIIGTRHGEKKHEALLSKEEMLKAEDMGDYYRVPADTRDLNYAQYYEEGDKSLTEKGDYTSENTDRLAVDGLINLLMKLDYIKQQMKS